MSIKRMDEIEDRIARGQMNAAQVFTQMKQLCQASFPEIPDSSVIGNAVAMGDLTDEEGNLHKKSILIQFASVGGFGTAVKSGWCQFTVLGGSV
jgi:hypothetical protein